MTFQTSLSEYCNKTLQRLNEHFTDIAWHDLNSLLKELNNAGVDYNFVIDWFNIDRKIDYDGLKDYLQEEYGIIISGLISFNAVRYNSFKNRKEVKQMTKESMKIKDQENYKAKGHITLQMHGTEMAQIAPDFEEITVGAFKTTMCEKFRITQKLQGRAYTQDIENKLAEAEGRIKELEAGQ